MPIDNSDLEKLLMQCTASNKHPELLNEAPMPLLYSVDKPELEPVIGSAQAAGMDLRCNLNLRKDQPFLILKPNENVTFGTGIRVVIPEGWVGLVMPRSGLGFKYEVMLANTTGVIDSDYRGEIMVKLVNRGKQDMILEQYDRVVQMVVVPHWYMKHIQKVSPEVIASYGTDRGEGGFGHTGTK